MANAPDKNLKISFCTTVMNRGYHLVQTLPQNLANNADHPNTEFVILDYGDSDGIPPLKENKVTSKLEVDLKAPKEKWKSIKSWLIDEFSKEIKSGKIKYVRTEQEHFRMSHAKNMVHRCASDDSDVLVNLDADNILPIDPETSLSFAGWLNQKYSQSIDQVVKATVKDKVYAKFQGQSTDGFTGRIAVHPSHFRELHGYDENLNAWGGDDHDFEARANALNLPTLALPRAYYGEVLPHSKESRYKHMAPTDVAKSIENLKKKGGIMRKMKVAAQLLNIRQEKDFVKAANKGGISAVVK
ncbi:MAG: galactosyltransferase-related protein [Rickettsiales bacterium]|nr:galactosyltransferase-related protein [Rickettsiales bacterium]